MFKPAIPIEWYLEASDVFDWAYMRHYVLWFTGRTGRHQRTEKVLKKLARKGKLRSHLYGKKLIYKLERRAKSFDEITGLAKVKHGLACTECLVRFFRSRTDGMVIAERHFAGLGAVPEWGIVYPNGKMLLFEFCTKSNFLYTGNMRGKQAAYRKHLRQIEGKFNSQAMVIFVLDVPRNMVKRYVGCLGELTVGFAGASPEGDGFPSDPFFFTDYETFLKVPIGEQLKAPIYIWVDGKEYPLHA